MEDTDMQPLDLEEKKSAAPATASAAASSSSSSSIAAKSVNPAHRTGIEEGKKGDNLPWVEKYRPSALDELISHEDIIHTVTKLIDSNQLPHLLFYGPPGTGKTSSILAVARKINGPNYKNMVLELNASDDRGIDVVREQIKDFASSRKLFSHGLKLVILDEADAMTRIAQFALRRVIEKYTKSTRFCLLCNFINKIIPALQSRCTRFRFGPLQTDQVRSRLEFVIKQENCAVTPDGLTAIMKLAGGDMRKSLNVLQACHMAYSEINELAVYSCTGNPLPSDLKLMLNLLNNAPFQKAFESIYQIQIQKGLSLIDMITFLHELILQINYPPPVMNFILSEMSAIEYRLSHGTNDKLQLASLVGVFKQACQMTEQFQVERENKEKSKAAIMQ